MKKSVIIFISLAVIVVLYLLGANASNDSITKVVSKEHPTNNEVQELIDGYSEREIKDSGASITGQDLIVYHEEGEEKYPLGEELFFISFAPYIDTTHPCETHSLSGCQGEMVNEDVEVVIKTEDGEIIFDETMSTGGNGFINLWVTRDQTYELKIFYEGKEVSQSFSSFSNSATCITTLQLK